MEKGFFISLEGIDGSGKSTQAQLLSKYLEELGYDVVLSREPGGTQYGEEIRRILLNLKLDEVMTDETEACLFAAARAQHVQRLILPSLHEGKIVVTDRFIDSSLAYQGEMRNLGIESVYKLNRWAIGNTLPDLTIFITLSEEEYKKRNQHKNLDRIEESIQSDSFHIINRAYSKIEKMFPNRLVTINGDSTLYEVFEVIKNIVEERLNHKIDNGVHIKKLSL